MTDSLVGMRLTEALDILKRDGITPEIIYSMPPYPLKDLDQRTARVVRYQDNRLLCSFFKDQDPKEP